MHMQRRAWRACCQRQCSGTGSVQVASSCRTIYLLDTVLEGSGRQASALHKAAHGPLPLPPSGGRRACSSALEHTGAPKLYI